MAIIARQNMKEYPIPPEGLYQAVCIDVIDNGVQPTPWGEKQMVTIRFQLSEIDEASGERFRVQKRYTLSMHKKSGLSKDLETWRGKKYTDAERKEGVNLDVLVGENAQVQVVHSIADDGRTWANIQAILPLGKAQVPIAGENYTRNPPMPSAGKSSASADDQSQEALEKLPF